MKKILLISILLIGCGSRQKDLVKTHEENKFESISNVSENISVSKNMSSVTDIRTFLINNGLKIKSTGQNYELRYGDFIFSGNADLEFIEKKEETKVTHIYQVHTTYVTETKYQTNTKYRFVKKTKDLKTQKSGISFGSLIIIVICSISGGALIWELFKNKFLKYDIYKRRPS